MVLSISNESKTRNSGVAAGDGVAAAAAAAVGALWQKAGAAISTEARTTAGTTIER